MMTIMVYKNGVLIEKMKAERLDVNSKTLYIDGVIIGQDLPRDYFYVGDITFQLIRDTLRIDLFEKNEGGTEDHIRITAFNW